MVLKLYNTLTRKKETFKPLVKGKVGMYSCGPTVYDFAHIGNFRAYIVADILKRYLKFKGFKIKHVMNITDVDDKTIKGSIEQKISLNQYTEKYTKAFFEDLRTLNIEPADIFPRATEHIKEMVSMIQKLIMNGLAYKGEDNSWYYDISKFRDYGKLSKLKLGELKEGARVKQDSYEKEQAQDFALWKAYDKDDGDVFWETDLGKGRPGWHIECSAMSLKFLGEQFDIHTGGIDHVTIHHTNEIAQSECATDKKPFVRFWMHNEHVDFSGAKMAKSGTNFLTLNSIIEKNINPIAYRFWLLMANYRTKVNFVWEALKGAETALKRLYGLYLELGNDIGQVHKEYQGKFKEYIEDDLDTPRALSLLWDVLKDENMSPADKKATILDFDKVLGLGFDKLKEEKIPKKVLELVGARRQARQNKDFKRSDELRKEINALNYEVKDTAEGQKVSKI